MIQGVCRNLPVKGQGRKPQLEECDLRALQQHCLRNIRVIVINKESVVPRRAIVTHHNVTLHSEMQPETILRKAEVISVLPRNPATFFNRELISYRVSDK